MVPEQSKNQAWKVSLISDQSYRQGEGIKPWKSLIPWRLRKNCTDPVSHFKEVAEKRISMAAASEKNPCIAYDQKALQGFLISRIAWLGGNQKTGHVVWLDKRQDLTRSSQNPRSSPCR